MLVGTNDGRVDKQLLQIGIARQRRRNTLPDAFFAPARETNKGPVPMPKFCRKITPRATCAHDPEHGLDKAPIVLGRNAAIARFAWQ